MERQSGAAYAGETPKKQVVGQRNSLELAAEEEAEQEDDDEAETKAKLRPPE